jgi:hypothetical protein
VVLGQAENAACEPVAPADLASFNNVVTDSTLHVGVVSAQGMTLTAGDEIVRCSFRAPQDRPEESDFVLDLVSVTDSSGGPMTPEPAVSVSFD